MLEAAVSPADMDKPGWKLHPLKGLQKGRWAVSVSGNWRLTFEVRGGHAFAVNFENYH